MDNDNPFRHWLEGLCRDDLELRWRRPGPEMTNPEERERKVFKAEVRLWHSLSLDQRRNVAQFEEFNLFSASPSAEAKAAVARLLESL